MRTTVSILAALLMLSGCGGGSDPSPPAGDTATVRLPVILGRPASGYFRLRISGDRGALLSVSSPQAGRVEMHETMNMGNMTGMRSIGRIPVRDGETLDFTPGGRHLMLFDIRRGVAAGDRIDLILHFEGGDPVKLTATLVPVGGDVGP
jgi:copper(I)-binding protein